MPDWKAEDSYPRLLAAIVASTDAKLDYHKVAAIFGRGATYDSIKGQFRKIKNDATALKSAYESGNPDVAASATNLNGNGEKKGKGAGGAAEKKDKTIGGRVTKGASQKVGVKGKGKAAKIEEDEGENAGDVRPDNGKQGDEDAEGAA